MKSTRVQPMMVLLGGALSFLLLFLFYALSPTEGGSGFFAQLMGYLAGATSAVAVVIPSFLVGYFANRRGFILGASAAALGSMAWTLWWSSLFTALASAPTLLLPIILQALLVAIGPSIIGSVSGAAGQFASSRRGV